MGREEGGEGGREGGGREGGREGGRGREGGEGGRGGQLTLPKLLLVSRNSPPTTPDTLACHPSTCRYRVH